MNFEITTDQIHLSELQSELDALKDAGIRDLYGCLNTIYVLLKLDGKVIGVASINCIGESCWELYKLFVSPKHQGKGYASIIVEKAIEYLKSNNVFEMFVESTFQSNSFWNKILQKKEFVDYGDGKFAIQID